MIRIAGLAVTAALLLAVPPSSLNAQQEERLRRAEAAVAAIRADDIARDVHYLASDALLGRATPSPGLDSAAAYIVRLLERLGYTPAGDDGGWFQYYRMVSSVLDTSATAASAGGRPLSYGDDFVIQSFLVPGIHEGEVVYVGDGMRIPARNVDPYAGLDLRGRWLLVAPPSQGAGGGRGNAGVPGIDYFTAADVAREAGARGILQLPSAATEAGWNSFRSRRVAVRELMPAVGRAYSAYPLPRVMLSRSGAAALLAGSGLTPEAASPDTSSAPPAPRLLPATSRFRVEIAAQTTEHRPYNVVALLEGSDPAVAGEWVSAAAHLDGAVGRGTTPAGDSVYNAADDNASGSAGLMAVARALKAGPAPRRSVLLVWDSGEEVGLWGSRHLAYGPLAERIVAHLNVDMIGRTRAPGTDNPAENDLAGPGEVFVAGPSVLSSSMHRTLERVRSNYSHATLTPRHDDPSVSFFYPRTDAAPYIEVGIPVLQFFTGLHGDYHRQTDEPSLLDIPKMEGVSRMVYLSLWLVAEQQERPRWDRPVPPQLHFVTPRP